MTASTTNATAATEKTRQRRQWRRLRLLWYNEATATTNVVTNAHTVTSTTVATTHHKPETTEYSREGVQPP